METIRVNRKKAKNTCTIKRGLKRETKTIYQSKNLDIHPFLYFG